jgi:hypothetical protein
VIRGLWAVLAAVGGRGMSGVGGMVG